MDPYVVTLHLGLGIGVVIGPAFYISIVIWNSLGFYWIEKWVWLCPSFW